MRLIDGDKLYSSLYEIRMYEVAKYGRHDTAHCCSLSTALFEIKNAPTIESMEVVRCKDCRWGEEKCGNIECDVDRNAPPEYHGYDWFCPNGERREDERT